MAVRGPMDKFISTRELLDDIDEPIILKEFALGVLGSSDASYWNKNTISDIINPIISEIGKLPSSMNVPTKGITSILLQAWGENKDIICNSVDSDWMRLGRKARVLQDSRIIKDSSHLLFFIGARSDYYEKIAIREAKKGKIVYTIDAKTKELSQWVI